MFMCFVYVYGCSYVNIIFTYMYMSMYVHAYDMYIVAYICTCIGICTYVIICGVCECDRFMRLLFLCIYIYTYLQHRVLRSPLTSCQTSVVLWPRLCNRDWR